MVACCQGQAKTQGQRRQGQGAGRGVGQGHSLSPNATRPKYPLAISVKNFPLPLVLHFEKTQTKTFNYTLICDHPSTIYQVTLVSTDTNVAELKAGFFLNISCADAFFVDNDNNSNSNEIGSRNNQAGIMSNINSNESDTAYSLTTTTMMTNLITTTVATTINQRDEIGNGNASSSLSAGISSENSGESRGGISGTLTGEFNVTFEALLLGKSFLLIYANKVSGPGSEIHSNQIGIPKRPAVVFQGMIMVIKLMGLLDDIFPPMAYVVTIMATIGMGIKVDILVIKETLKKPMAPAIGLFSQYICMPLVSERSLNLF